MRRIAALVVVLAAGAAGFAGYRLWNAAAPTDAGGHRPQFALPDLGGTPQPISQWDGKVLIVNFWATWCEPCREEIPLLESVQAEYAAREVQVIGIAIDERGAVQRFVDQLGGISYPVLIGEQEAVDALAAFGAEVTALPYTAFVARDGRVAALHPGVLHRGQVTGMLADLL